jgi:hypothetical protein
MAQTFRRHFVPTGREPMLSSVVPDRSPERMRGQGNLPLVAFFHYLEFACGHAGSFAATTAAPVGQLLLQKPGRFVAVSGDGRISLQSGLLWRKAKGPRLRLCRSADAARR